MNGTGVGLVKRFWSAVVDGRAATLMESRLSAQIDRLGERFAAAAS
jgi:hypothetical protein